MLKFGKRNWKLDNTSKEYNKFGDLLMERNSPLLENKKFSIKGFKYMGL